MIRLSDFPILNTKINGQPLVYFDNAATTQKPKVVIDAITDYYLYDNANLHSSINPLGERVLKKYQESREVVADFISASSEEIVFTSGATAGINLIAKTWGEANLSAGDVVILSIAEHHANIVPWLQLKERKKIKIKYINLLSDGSFDLNSAKKLLSLPKVKLLSLANVSNVLGIINPIEKIIKLAQSKNIITVVDASSGISHFQTDVKKIGCDFLVFSGHKLYGPTGIGVLYGRKELLDDLKPLFGGGGIIERVTLDSFTTITTPDKFEAGTPNIEGVIALAAACRYLKKLSWAVINKKEQELSNYFIQKIKEHKYISLIGDTKLKVPLFSFNILGIHAHDVADFLGQKGIIVRAGQHCAQPLHNFLKLPASIRASLSFYNTEKEIDLFFKALKEVYSYFNS